MITVRKNKFYHVKRCLETLHQQEKKPKKKTKSFFKTKEKIKVAKQFSHFLQESVNHYSKKLVNHILLKDVTESCDLMN